MTVAEYIAALSTLPADAIAVTGICECYGDHVTADGPALLPSAHRLASVPLNKYTVISTCPGATCDECASGITTRIVTVDLR